MNASATANPTLHDLSLLVGGDPFRTDGMEVMTVAGVGAFYRLFLLRDEDGRWRYHATGESGPAFRHLFSTLDGGAAAFRVAAETLVAICAEQIDGESF